MPTTPIAYDPSVVDQRLSQQRRRALGGLFGVVTSAVLAGVLFLMLRTSPGGVSPEMSRAIVGFLIFSASISAFLGLVNGLWYWRMTRQRIVPGLALQLSPLGVETEDARIPWEEITRMTTGWSPAGDGHTLRIERLDGTPVELPLDSLTIKPGSLDSAIRAYSGGRVALDLAAYGA